MGGIESIGSTSRLAPAPLASERLLVPELRV